MSDQPIRFCNAPDGVRLAMAIGGQGPTIVKAANWLSHLQEETRLFASRHWIAELSRRNRLVRYDSRGCGLSERKVDRISLDAWVDDLEAVVDAADADRFVLFGISQGAAVAISYAVRHPERVKGLILCGAFARGLLRQGCSPRVEAAAEELIRLAELGWGRDTASFRQVFTSQIFDTATAEEMRAFDDCHRDTVSGEVAARYMRVFYEIDICDIAARVACPTLVLHCRDDRLVLPREGRLIASLIPGARFVEAPGGNHVALATDTAWPVIRDEMRTFLDTLEAFQPGDAPRSLTERQRQVLKLIAQGSTDKAVARELGLSPRTVEMHVGRILESLGARNRSDAVRRALQWRMID